MINFLYNKSFAGSILLHAVLILWLGFNLLQFEKEKNVTLPSAEHKALQAYIYQIKHSALVPKTQQVKSKNTLKNKWQNKQLSVANTGNTTSQQKEVVDVAAMATDSNSQAIDEFLKVLHDIIQAHQRYPKQAQIMQNKGTALVKFTLFPDGHMENISLIKSSQTESLDEAALLAVNEAAPIREAAAYLKDKKSFTVHVDFQ